MKDPRITELEEWEQETGRTLPMSPEEIIALEEEDMLVDLETGEILLDLENQGILVG